jgi:hypothetical protein
VGQPAPVSIEHVDAKRRQTMSDVTRCFAQVSRRYRRSADEPDQKLIMWPLYA